MKTDDQSLGKLFLDQEPPGHECPPAADLVRLVAGELGEERREAILEHLESCSLCAQEVRVARSLEGFSEHLAERLDETTEASEAEADPDRGGTVRSGPWTTRAWWPAAAAAAMIVLLLGAFQLWRVDTPTQVPDGGTGSEQVRAPAEEVSPAAGARLAVAPEKLRWPAQVGATGYRVTLYDASAQPLWQSSTGIGTELELPADTLARLAPGGDYFWVVDVAGDVRRTRLGPFEFHLEL